jgi:tetratricopeptide (TPR) repeat protein
MMSLAYLYRDQGKLSEAESLLVKSLEGRRRAFGENHARTLTAMNDLAYLYRRQGRQSEAEALATKVFEGRRSVLGDEHQDTLGSMNDLAALYLDRDKPSQAERLLTRAFEVNGRVRGEEHPKTLVAMHNLVHSYVDQGKLAEAEPLMTRWVEILRRKPGDLPYALYLLGRNRFLQGRYADAEPVARECLTIHRKSSPNGWECYACESLLGGILLGQERDAEAEPLLLSGYEGIKVHEPKSGPGNKARRLRVMERIVKLYEARGQAEKAAAWKAKLGLANLPDDVFARP